MRLILTIGILLLTLSCAIDETDHTPRLALYVGRGKSSAARVETESGRTRAETLSPLLPTTSVPAGAAASPHQPQLAYNGPETLYGPEAWNVAGSDSHAAIYDIAAHTVYLPDGDQLEAHSGLGQMLDDPRYVDVKGRGPAPPNVYDLTLRSGLFHGLRAIRLNPVPGSTMFGRDNILAHTYMLGPNGQSFGCVSFKDYPKFLDAFLRGEVDRMVVVPHLESEPPVASVPQRIAANIVKLAELIKSNRF
jgi:hypothetical protein